MKWFIRKFLTVLVIGILAVLASGCFGIYFKDQSEKIELKETLEAEEINEITIDGELAEIHIHTHDQNKITAEVTGKTSNNLVTDFQVDTSGKSAIIKLSQDQKSPISLNFSEPKLNVYIPDKMYETLTLRTAFGDLTSEQKLLSKRININADEGNIVLNGYQGEVIKGNINLGNITLHSIDASFDLETAEGDVNVSLNTGLKGKNQMNAKFGDVKIKLPKEPEILSFDLRAKFGEIHSDFSFVDTSNSDDNVLKGEIGQPATNSPTLSVITESGHITLLRH